MRLGALDLDRAPTTPGIYAWYAQLALSSKDWMPRVREDVDLANQYAIDAIAEYFRIHQELGIELTGASAYDMRWEGTLRKRDITGADTEIERLAERILPNIESPNERRLLIQMLKEAPPYFASPLYVGVTSNLRQRLSDHRKSYEAASAVMKQSPGDARRLQSEGPDLGSRLAGAGIPLERLECWILSVPDESTTKIAVDRQRKVVEAVEWVIQRIFQPVMGRR